MATLTAHFQPSAQELHRPQGVVGPNAVLQMQAALEARFGRAGAEQVFAAAGHQRLLRQPPGEMIDEQVPAALFRALWHELPSSEAVAIAHDAGRRTGAYILENRIPKPAQLLLKALPPRLAAPILLKAIEESAWTFAGSGDCRAKSGRPAKIEIAANPLSMPGCIWHIGVFEELFGALVHEGVRVAHTDCLGAHRRVCRFEIDWPRARQTEEAAHAS